jgi:hypothetical protein
MRGIGSFNSFTTSLIGLPISHLWRGHGSAIFLEIGTLTLYTKRDGSSGEPQGEVSLGVEWSWRIEANRSIVCGSWSEEHLWQPTLDGLRGRRIKNIELFGILPEVVVTTDTDVRFVSFSTTDGQPQWWMTDKRGSRQRTFSVEDGQLHVEAP